jgi:hypothetical protein
MFKSDASKVYARLLILVALIMCLGIFFRYPNAAPVALSQSQAAPGVTITPQANSPLRIVSASIDAKDPLETRLNVIIENASGKAIESYAISRTGVTEHSQSIATTLVNITSLGSALSPLQSDTETFASTYPEPLKSLAVSVDFVEFTDGSTWGVDRGKSGERLKGVRSGLAARKSAWLKKLKTEGDSPLRSFISGTGTDETAVPTGHSPEWEDGFRTSSGILRKRLERAYSTGGLYQVESELKKSDSLQADGGPR